MYLSGLANNILEASIVAGRKGFATKAKAEEVRVLYETGIAVAMTSFQQAQTTADLQTLVLFHCLFYPLINSSLFQKSQLKLMNQNASVTLTVPSHPSLARQALYCVPWLLL